MSLLHHKHHRMVSLGLGFAIASTLCLVSPLTQIFAQPEPQYRGRSLQYWKDLLKSSEPRQRATAVMELAKLDEEALPILEWGLRDSSNIVRAAALRGIIRLGPDAQLTTNALIQILKHDSNRDILVLTIQSLGAIGPTALDALDTIHVVKRKHENDYLLNTEATKATRQINER